jgi:NAD(P)-dependent dehydrogenase (short-subunit alcohol dehydrogenase family)
MADTTNAAHPLEGRCAAVIGVGEGFGRACAEQLHGAGAELLLVARTRDKLERIAGEIGGASALACDAATPEGASEVAAWVEATWGRLDVLVLVIGGSGAAFGVRFEDCDPGFESWRRAFESNFWAPAQCVRALLPSLKKGAEAKVVTVNTMAAEWVRAGLIGYSAPKAALAALVKGLAIELGQLGIRVNGVHPGTMSNAAPWFERRAREEGLDPEAVIRSEVGPLGYLPDPAEVARTVLFLATDASRPVTGQGIHVNCGQWFS